MRAPAAGPARWPEGFRCPACGHARAWELGRERLTLRRAACERQVPVAAGTVVLHRSHLPLRTWSLAAWLVATRRDGGTSARRLQLGLGSHKTARLPLRKLRRAMVDPDRQPLAGLVEVDEAGPPLRAARR